MDSNELACVMIPLADTHLLLPNISIAEILPWRRIRALPDMPPWCLGMLGWRGETLPVIQFETLNGASSGVGGGRASGRAFYGLAAAGLPRIVHLTSDDLHNQSVKLGPAEVAALRVGTESAVVPNLTFVEEQLASLP